MLLKILFLNILVQIITFKKSFCAILFNYGFEQGDSIISNAVLKSLDIGFKFSYMNTYYDQISISQNGNIGLLSPDFFINVYRSKMTLNGGNLFYQSYVNRSSELENLASLVQTKMGDRFGVRFDPENAFVITWDSMNSQNATIDTTVTFQLILISNKFRSFMIFSYGDLGFPCTEINLRHITKYENFDDMLLSSLNQNSNVNENGVYIFEVNANFVCDQAVINQSQILNCKILSNQSDVYNLEIKFCDQIYKHSSNGNGSEIEIFNLQFKCLTYFSVIVNKIELSIFDMDLNSLVYRNSITIIKDIYTTNAETTNLLVTESSTEKITETTNLLVTESNTEKIAETTNLLVTESNTEKIAETTNLLVTESSTEKIAETTNLLVTETFLVQSYWFALSTEIKSNNLIQKYFEKWIYDSFSSQSIFLLEEIKCNSLIKCSSYCHQSQSCNIFNFEESNCKIYTLTLAK